jgi:hypothetical protein
MVLQTSPHFQVEWPNLVWAKPELFPKKKLVLKPPLRPTQKLRVGGLESANRDPSYYYTVCRSDDFPYANNTHVYYF